MSEDDLDETIKFLEKAESESGESQKSEFKEEHESSETTNDNKVPDSTTIPPQNTNKKNNS